MRLLIGENLPESVGSIFAKRGWSVACVSDLAELRGQPDEVIFSYAAAHQAVIVTRDLRFVNPTQFVLGEVPGIIILRFPNDISIGALSGETERLIHTVRDENFHNIVVIEPGSMRIRPLKKKGEGRIKT